MTDNFEQCLRTGSDWRDTNLYRQQDIQYCSYQENSLTHQQTFCQFLEELNTLQSFIVTRMQASICGSCWTNERFTNYRQSNDDEGSHHQTL